MKWSQYYLIIVGCQQIYLQDPNQLIVSRYFEENELFKLFKLEWFLKVKERRGIDNFDTFVPVVKITSTRVLIVWVSIYNLNHREGFVLPRKKK